VTTVKELTKDMPRCMYEYMKYVRNLEFHKTPDYKYLIELFDEHMKENDIEMDGNHDWIVQK
jgi:hypothetical protein